MASGSSPLTIKTMNRWKEITGHTLLERYGMTEFGMGLTNSYEDAEARIAGHVGHPFPGVTAGIFNPETGLVHQDMDSEGELLIQSPTMFDRYLDAPEATDESFFSDKATGQKWFKTGDCAIRSSEHDGSYKILGRFS